MVVSVVTPNNLGPEFLIGTATPNKITIDPARIAAMFRTCAGGIHNANPQIPTCAEMTAAIATAIAAIPADIYLTGLASYNGATNILTLNMSDGSTVPVDLTDLITDALDDFVIVSADAGNDVSIGTDGGAYLDVQAHETTTTFVGTAVTSEITYTDEDGAATTVRRVSADTNNSITVGTDGGAHFDASFPSLFSYALMRSCGPCPATLTGAGNVPTGAIAASVWGRVGDSIPTGTADIEFALYQRTA